MDLTKLDQLEEQPKRSRTNQLEKRRQPDYKKAGRPATGKKRKPFSLSFDEKMIQRIEEHCLEHHINKSSLGEKLFEDYLNKHG